MSDLYVYARACGERAWGDKKVCDAGTMPIAWRADGSRPLLDFQRTTVIPNTTTSVGGRAPTQEFGETVKRVNAMMEGSGKALEADAAPEGRGYVIGEEV